MRKQDGTYSPTLLQDQVTESQNLAARCEKEVEGLNEKLQSADIEYASQKQLLMQEMERESQAHSNILLKKEEQLRELELKNLRLEVPIILFFKPLRLLRAWELVMKMLFFFNSIRV